MSRRELDCAHSDRGQEDREVANDALQALLEDATPTSVTGRFVTSNKGSLQRRIAAGEADTISDRERAQLQEIRQTYIRTFGVDSEV